MYVINLKLLNYYCKRVQMLNISNKIGLFTFNNFKHLIE